MRILRVAVLTLALFAAVATGAVFPPISMFVAYALGRVTRTEHVVRVPQRQRIGLDPDGRLVIVA